MKSATPIAKCFFRILWLACLTTTLLADELRAELTVPAHSAYLDPVASKVRVVKEKGIEGWDDPETRVLWFGQLNRTGKLSGSVMVRLAKDQTTKLRLTCAGKSQEVEFTGSGRTAVERLSFGAFEIEKTGYHEFCLESLNEAGAPAGSIEALIVSGPASEGAHFNVKPRRNAASVHLAYPVAKESLVEGFYCEMIGIDDPVHSYYMACGWHRGYFGMQVNSETERRIIFSVWDSGNEAVDRDKVAEIDRVQLVAKGENVYSGSFGNEGTGGHSHLKFQWKTGEKQRFFVTAEPVDKTFTIFSGYYFRPDLGEWMLISSWKAPREGGYLRGLYSFSENFVGRNGHLRRKALYGNLWLRTPEGKWIEQLDAKFSHDATGKEDRLDRFMGLQDGQFFLSHGGFVEGFTRFGERFSRPAVGIQPELDLPEVKPVQ